MRLIQLVFIGMLSLLLGCSSETASHRDAILRVLRSDDQVASKLKQLPKDTIPSQAAKVVGEYCQAQEALDLAACPPNFRVAYRHHLLAWRELQAALQVMPDTILEGMLVGTINGLQGELDGGAGRMSEAMRRAQEKIKQTWIEAEQIGAKYGAAL